MFPPAPPPVVLLLKKVPSILNFEAIIWTSAPDSGPAFDVMIELPRLSVIPSAPPGVVAVVSTASFTERTNCPPRIETVFSPLTLILELDAMVTDPKEVNDAPSTA